MKRCAKCLAHKNETEFYKSNPGYLATRCKVCVRAHQKRQWRDGNTWKQRLRKKLDSLKEAPCMDCKKRYPCYVMQFDHVRGKKKDAVSNLYRDTSSFELIL